MPVKIKCKTKNNSICKSERSIKSITKSKMSLKPVITILSFSKKFFSPTFFSFAVVSIAVTLSLSVTLKIIITDPNCNTIIEISVNGISSLK